MACEQFKEIRFRHDSLVRIDQCNEIVESYLKQGYRMTLRQLYYQLVKANVIPNVEKSYKNLSTLVSDARLAGLMDWHAIEDRIRRPDIPIDFETPAEAVEWVRTNYYRRPRWRGQEYYVELWVEKDALAGVLAPIADEYHVTLMVNRGYSSQSAMYESAQRFERSCNEKSAKGKRRKPVLLYLGDHDPSGEDMVRDIEERLVLFGVDDLTVVKIALTKKQIEKYKPEPNPAKMKDPRAGDYVRKHGRVSWEVDALDPTVLGTIVRAALDHLRNKKLMEKSVLPIETRHKEMLSGASARLVDEEEESK